MASAHRANAAKDVQYTHSGRSGRTDLLYSDTFELVWCADGRSQALSGARRRWQGWQVKATRVEPCERNPDKVHVNVSKKAKAKR
jgi:hypothetical protein